MPIFAYRCRSCTRTYDYPQRLPSIRCECGEEARRDFSSVQIGGASAFQPHFNHSVGKFVSTSSEFDTELKRAAEDNSARTGTDHSYSRIDPGDLPRPTKDDHIFEDQQRAWRNHGPQVSA